MKYQIILYQENISSSKDNISLLAKLFLIFNLKKISIFFFFWNYQIKKKYRSNHDYRNILGMKIRE